MTGFRFMVGQPQAAYLQGLGGGSPAPTADPGTIALLARTHPFLILTTLEPGRGYPATDCSGPTAVAPASWQAVYLIRFTSEAEEAAQFSSGGVPSCVSWIMYDNEPNTLPPTPPGEQLDPPTYMLAAANLAHANGKAFMGTAGDGVPALLPQLYANAGAYDAYDEQIQTGECPDVAHFVAHLVTEAAHFQRVHPTIMIAAGFGDAVGINCYAGLSGPAGALTYVPPSYVDSYLEAFPSNVRAWGNYGPKMSGPNGGGIPSHYADWSTTVRDTLAAPLRTPLPLPT